MKKFLKKSVLLLSVMVTVLVLNASIGLTLESAALEQSEASELRSPADWLRIIGEDQDVLDIRRHPDAPPDFEPGVAAVTSPILYLIDFFRYLMSGIAFIVVVIAAIKLISGADEEKAKKIKGHLLMGVVGLLVIQLADPLVKRMVFGEMGEAFEDPGTAEMFAEETVVYIRSLIGLVHIFLGAVAVLVIIIRGIVVLTAGADEEQLTKAKKHVIYAVVGLAIVGVSEGVVRGVIFPAEGEALPDVEAGRSIIVGITNFLSGFVAIAAFLMLFYAGYYYVVSGGQEEANEKVKKTIFAAVIGLVLAMAAYAIVNTFLGMGTEADVVIQ